MDQVPQKADRLTEIGDWLGAHRHVVAAVQWTMVAIYLLLIVTPALLPLPAATSRILDSLVLFAQFMFWGVWWPAAILSVVLAGRVWCGLLCPEGALTEFASRHGRARAIPRWVRWPGWPFGAFVTMTIYGQMVSVYQYPKPALLILGGSTLAAILVGLLFGRSKRVWCRYLCPVNGVFRLFARLSPLHFAVDAGAWKRSQKLPRQRFAPVDCAPLIAIRTMRGASHCHMCGRCSGFRGAVQLAARSPNREIVELEGEVPEFWEVMLLIFGLIGVAAGAFQWSASPWFVELKIAVANWLVNRELMWPLVTKAPWWILTDYPANSDVLYLLDGALLVFYVGAVAVAIGSAVALCLALASRCLGRWSNARYRHLALAMTPVAAAGVFLGLSGLTVTVLKAEGFVLGFVPAGRAIIILSASLWAMRLAYLITKRYTSSVLRRSIALAAVTGAVLFANLSAVMLFFVW